MSISPLLEDLALARSTVDRSAHLRKDSEAMSRAWADTSSRVIAVHRGCVGHTG